VDIRCGSLARIGCRRLHRCETLHEGLLAYSQLDRTGDQTHNGPGAKREECIVLRPSEAAIHAAGISEQVTIMVRCITLQVLLFMHLQKTDNSSCFAQARYCNFRAQSSVQSSLHGEYFEMVGNEYICKTIIIRSKLNH
jgi:hypothetical protein